MYHSIFRVESSEGGIIFVFKISEIRSAEVVVVDTRYGGNLCNGFDC